MPRPFASLFPILLLAIGVFCQSPKPAGDCNGTQDVVLLKIELLASGKIGEIEVLKGLPNGLTDQAINAARRIKFEPATRDGVPRDVRATVEYKFAIYFDEDSTELRTPAKITRMPVPKVEKKKESHEPSKIKVLLLLKPDGKVEIQEVKGELPRKITEAVSKAALGIKFKPAVHTCGIEVPQFKTVEYSIN